MTPWQLGRFVIAVLATAAAVHVVGVVLVVVILHSVYPHRIFNVHRWSDNGVENYRLVGTFLAAKARSQQRPVMVFAGSSVTYGDVWPAAVTFPALVAERRRPATVLNASIIAADVSAINDWIVCAARRNAIRVDTV